MPVKLFERDAASFWGEMLILSKEGHNSADKKVHSLGDNFKK